jgi:hypothetical protein
MELQADLVSSYTVAEMTQKLNAKFGTDHPEGSVKNWLRKAREVAADKKEMEVF